MKLLGYITHRDEDGTWYAEKVDGNDIWGWCLDKSDAHHEFTPEQALEILPALESHGMRQVRYTASIFYE